jgi:hypothetical protein
MRTFGVATSAGTVCNPMFFVVRVTTNKRPPYPFDLADLLLAVEVESPRGTRCRTAASSR